MSTTDSLVSALAPARPDRTPWMAPKRTDGSGVVEVLVARCAGLDVGKREVQACVRVPDPNDPDKRWSQTRTFSTFTSGLEQLAEWLAGHGVTQVVMEATGQYWKPVWYVLEDSGFELLLVNARHVKILPGRKTDVSDAAWLAQLLEHGLLRGSFVPPPQVRQLRDLTRYRSKLTQVHTAETQRVQKFLEDAGIKLGSVASDVLGVSGRAMLTALIGGELTRKPLPHWPGGGCGPSCRTCARRCGAGSPSTTR